MEVSTRSAQHQGAQCCQAVTAGPHGLRCEVPLSAHLHCLMCRKEKSNQPKQLQKVLRRDLELIKNQRQGKRKRGKCRKKCWKRISI